MYSKNDAKVVLFVLIYKQKTGLFDVCLKYIAYLCAFLKNLEMTKAELCKSISAKTGCDAQTVLAVVESLMVEVKESLEKGENVYLRGFGSFIVKQRAEKTARNIRKNSRITMEEMADKLGVNARTIHRDIEELKHVVEHIGPTKAGYWKLLK